MTFIDPYGWGSSTIVHILKKREYLGHTVNFKTRKHFKDKKSHYVDESEWTIFENTHEAIIDQETFDNVQRIRANVRRYPDGYGEIHPLTGLMYCADCGGKMYVHRSYNGERIPQYTCAEYGKYPIGTRCKTQHRINASVVLTLIADMLVYLLSLLDDERDKIVFNEMYERYERRTFSTAMNILHNTYDSEDAVLAAWVKVALHFETAKKYLSKSWSAFEAWLIVVTKNAAKDELRKKRRAPEPMEMWDVPSRLNTETKSELNMIIELIHSMPEQTCALLEMRVIGEYSFKEIGKILGCSAGTAQKRYSRAMEILRERMGVISE